MYTSRKKIQKDKDVEPSEFEESVAQIWINMYRNKRSMLKDLKIYLDPKARNDTEIQGWNNSVELTGRLSCRLRCMIAHAEDVCHPDLRFVGKRIYLDPKARNDTDTSWKHSVESTGSFLNLQPARKVAKSEEAISDLSVRLRQGVDQRKYVKRSVNIEIWVYV
ncbi:Ribosomal protein S7e [Artemisia annua]|uniref:Ribosomal protein S7e n=1 Tax=Artemisia annua TaxID=35608 RepID=A0A2U1PYI3_ARTAN|nr:Ribosomal protein S7e [Artemisia annua]